MTNPLAIAIAEQSQVGEARRRATSLAANLGFNEIERGKVGIVATEVANNLLNHATDGILLLHPLEKQGVAGIEILSLDKGPGMSNLDECLRDGFSTSGTPGNGLGAVYRLSDLCEIYSVPQQGTAILCQLWADALPEIPKSDRIEVGGVCLPKPGETISGDAWTSCSLENRHLLLVADGLGHGPLAAQASLEAVKMLWENAHRSLPEIVETMHAALRSTRGAALAIADINFENQTLRYAGVGNIAGSVFASGRSSSMVSHHGTVGHEVRKIQEFSYPWLGNGLLIMHSDGLGSQWRLDRYPGLVDKHPSLIAGVLYRDFLRGRDDVTIVVARERWEC